MRIRDLVMCAGSVAAVGACVVSCAAATIPDEMLASEQTGTVPRKGGTKGDASADAPAPSTQGAPLESPTPSDPDAAAAHPADACAPTTNGDACHACCELANPKAVTILATAYAKCLCVPPAACAAKCANELCTGLPNVVGGACEKCVEDYDDECNARAQAACVLNSDCRGLFLCETASKCSSK